jgi:hypothetical protein
VGTWKESRASLEFCGNGDRRRGRTGELGPRYDDGGKEKKEKKKSGFPRQTRESRSRPPPRANAGENDDPEVRLFGCDTLRHRHATRAAQLFRALSELINAIFVVQRSWRGERGGGRSKVWGRKLQRSPSIRLNRNRVKGEANMGRERRENLPIKVWDN